MRYGQELFVVLDLEQEELLDNTLQYALPQLS